jgi:hypothetical protein
MADMRLAYAASSGEGENTCLAPDEGEGIDDLTLREAIIMYVIVAFIGFICTIGGR